MRMFGLVGLVLALLIVGLLARKQVATPSAATPTAREQTQRLQQDIQKSLDAAAQQQRRALSEDTN